MRAVAVLLLLGLALRPTPSRAEDSLRSRQLPQHYRALFEPGRVFYYRVKYVVSDGEVESVVHDGVAVCRVSQVSAEPEALRSVIVCAGIPAREDLARFSASAVGLIDGVWIARASGLWRDDQHDTFASRDGAKPQVASRPTPFKVEHSEAEFVAFRRTHLDGSNWCALRSELSGEEDGVKRCYSNPGIISALDYEAGGTLYEASMELISRARYLKLAKRRPD